MRTQREDKRTQRSALSLICFSRKRREQLTRFAACGRLHAETLSDVVGCWCVEEFIFTHEHPQQAGVGHKLPLPWGETWGNPDKY
jgi:hypothetical protein